LPRPRSRRGSRREGVNTTLTSIGLSLALGVLLYIATGISLFPILTLGAITFMPPLVLAYRGMILRGLGATLILSSFAGSLAYMAYLPGEPVTHLKLLQGTWVFLVVLLGFMTVGVASYLGAVYQWVIILGSLEAGNLDSLATSMLAWALLGYTTVLSAAVLRARSIKVLKESRSTVVVCAGATSLAIMYAAALLI